MLGFREVGNGVQYHIILLACAWLFGIVIHSDCEEREIIHKALEEVTHSSLCALLSDMGNIFWSKTTFEVAVAEFIATRDIRETDNEVGYGSVQNAEIHLFCSENRNFFQKRRLPIIMLQILMTYGLALTLTFFREPDYILEFLLHRSTLVLHILRNIGSILLTILRKKIISYRRADR